MVKRRHTLVWLTLTALLLSMVGGTVLWRLQTSSYFVVNHVEVVGATSLNSDSLVELSGALGTQLYRLDTAATEHSLEQLALVRSVRVRRLWPNGVQLTIQERRPWGTWQIGGVNYLVDERGVVLDIVAEPGSPTIYELDAAPGLRPGDHVDADAIQMAQELVTNLPRIISQHVAKLEYSSDGGLEFLTDQGVRIRLGDSQGLAYKLAVWQAINAKVGANAVHLVDLRSADRPFYR